MIRLMCAAVVGVLAFGPSAVAAPATANEFNTAYLVAQKLVPGGKLIKARVEGAPPADVFGFYFLLQGYVVEIEVSRSGTVLKNKKSNSDPVSKDVLKLLGQSKGPAKMPAGRLLEIAGDALKDTPFADIKYEVQGDRLVAIVNGVTIDATTGEVLGGR